MLANGGREITPSLVDLVQDRNGKIVYRHEPRTCRGCDAADGERQADAAPRPASASPSSIRHRSIRSSHDAGRRQRGTAGRLAALDRPIAGKTGTTNDAHDDWFLGSTPDIIGGVYIGFDEPRTLGGRSRRQQRRADLRWRSPRSSPRAFQAAGRPHVRVTPPGLRLWRCRSNERRRRSIGRPSSRTPSRRVGKASTVSTA